MDSDGSYLTYGGPKHTIGLVTKYGWTGPVQQALFVPGIYKIACELLGTNQLTVNGYEYKMLYPRKKNTSKVFEFLHAGTYF